MENWEKDLYKKFVQSKVTNPRELKGDTVWESEQWLTGSPRELVDFVLEELDKAREEGRREIAHKIIELDENTPDYKGYSELLEIGGKYFRSWDAESYSSGIDEVTKEEFDRLLEYKLKTKEDEK